MPETQGLPALLRLRDMDASLRAGLEAGCPAYRHALGFIHVQLPAPDGQKYRLHVWDEAGEPEAAQIHNHAFGFRSVVLEGAVEHCPYIVTPSGVRGPQARRLCRVIQDANSTRLQSSEAFVLIRGQRPQVYRVGQAYEFPAGAFHVGRPRGAGRAITFLSAKTSPSAPSYVLSPDDRSFTMSWSKRWLPSAFVSELLRSALIRLAALSAPGALEVER